MYTKIRDTIDGDGRRRKTIRKKTVLNPCLDSTPNRPFTKIANPNRMRWSTLFCVFPLDSLIFYDSLNKRPMKTKQKCPKTDSTISVGDAAWSSVIRILRQ